MNKVKKIICEIIIYLILSSACILLFNLFLDLVLALFLAKHPKESTICLLLFYFSVLIIIPSILAKNINNLYKEIINGQFGKRLANRLKKHDEFNFTTGFYLSFLILFHFFIWIVITSKNKSINKFDLMVICTTFIVVTLPFWFRYFQFCAKKIKKNQNNFFDFFVKTIRSIMISIAAVFLIVANIYSIGYHDSFKWILYAVAYITGCIGSLTYPLFDMYDYTNKAIGKKP